MKPARKKTFMQWFHSIAGQQSLVTVVFMIAPVFLLILFTYLPFAEMIKFSFFKMTYLTRRPKWIGWQNYQSVFSDPTIFGALKLSFYYMGGALIQTALALLLAAILTSGLKHTNFFKGCIFFPYLVCGISLGFIFKFFFTHGYVLDTILSWCGFNISNLPYWLNDTSVNNAMLVGTSIWKYTGQNMVLFIGAMMSVDSDLYEAASIDGANAWQRFRYITMPGIKTMIVLNLILSISGSLSAFEPPYVITGGTFGTATYFVVMDRIAHTNNLVGLASAMAIVLMGLIAVVTVIQKLVSYYLLDEDESGCTRRERRIAAKRRAVSLRRSSVHAGPSANAEP